MTKKTKNKTNPQEVVSGNKYEPMTFSYTYRQKKRKVVFRSVLELKVRHIRAICSKRNTYMRFIHSIPRVQADVFEDTIVMIEDLLEEIRSGSTKGKVTQYPLRPYEEKELEESDN